MEKKFLKEFLESTKWCNISSCGIVSSGGGSGPPPAAGVLYWIEAQSVAAPNATINVSSWTPNEPSVNADAVITPKGTGALLGQVPTATAAGGNKRGISAVDWQLGRFSNTCVASGDNSVISGGYDNTASSQYATVSGGNNNQAITNTSVTVGGGEFNIASGLRATVAGGSACQATGRGSFVGGGETVKATNTFATASGGKTNTCSGNSATLGGGQSNTCSANNATIGGGVQNNNSGGDGTIAGGSTNTVTANQGTVGGGQNNQVAGQYGTVGGGYFNLANAYSSCVPGGYNASCRNIVGAMVFGGALGGAPGGTGVQISWLVLSINTNFTTTPTALTTDLLNPSTTNQLTLPNNSIYLVKGMACARETSTGDAKVWDFTVAIKRGANAAATVLLAAVTPNVVANDAGAAAWTLTVTADTTNGSLRVTGTGDAAKGLRWICRLDAVELG